MRREVEVVEIDALDFAESCKIRKENEINLTFGPEQPLAEGIVDYFNEQGLTIFGPFQRQRKNEGSKSFAKELMKKYNIPTADYETFTEVDKAISYIKEKGAPIVVKADRACSGKGAIVAMTEQEAIDAVTDMIGNQLFGEVSSRVVIEEFLMVKNSPSCHSYIKDKSTQWLLLKTITLLRWRSRAKHRRDGAYSPVPQIPQEVVTRAYTEIVEPTVKAMEEEGASFTGILYAGLILTEDGPKVIEFNARFGDPETQVVLPRMTSDFGLFMKSLMEEKYFDLQWSNEPMLGVVVAAEGYPGSVKKEIRYLT